MNSDAAKTAHTLAVLDALSNRLPALARGVFSPEEILDLEVSLADLAEEKQDAQVLAKIDELRRSLLVIALKLAADGGL